MKQMEVENCDNGTFEIELIEAFHTNIFEFLKTAEAVKYNRGTSLISKMFCAFLLYIPEEL